MNQAEGRIERTHNKNKYYGFMLANGEWYGINLTQKVPAEFAEFIKNLKKDDNVKFHWEPTKSDDGREFKTIIGGEPIIQVDEPSGDPGMPPFPTRKEDFLSKTRSVCLSYAKDIAVAWIQGGTTDFGSKEIKAMAQDFVDFVLGEE